MAQDYYAKALWREEDLANDALSVRRKHGYADNELSFNIIECLYRLDFTRAVPQEYFDLVSGEDPGYVTYDPLTLHLAKTIRDAAYKHEGYARGVIAHEISHLRLHSYGFNSFSPMQSHKETWYVQERSVEWQARTWTGYFLLPDSIIRIFESPEQIVELCAVDLPTAKTRFDSFQERERRRAGAGLCLKCRDFAEPGTGLCAACRKELLQPSRLSR